MLFHDLHSVYSPGPNDSLYSRFGPLAVTVHLRWGINPPKLPLPLGGSGPPRNM